jgi:hypothetical protein
LTVW